MAHPVLIGAPQIVQNIQQWEKQVVVSAAHTRLPPLDFSAPTDWLVSCCTPAHPQEGELRPQLLDRFGMSVMVTTLQDTKQRTALVMDR